MMSISLKAGQSISLGRVGRPPNLSRVASVLAGASTYRGASCNAGHNGVRYVSTRACVKCVREHGRRALQGPFLLIDGEGR